LAAYLPKRAAEPSDDEPAGGDHSMHLPAKLVEVATASIPWARAVSLMLAISWGLTVILDILLMFVLPSAVLRIIQFMSAVYGMFAVYACVMCFRYTTPLAAMRYTRSAQDLGKALQRLYVFWIWSAVLIIAFFLLILFFALLIVGGMADAMSSVGGWG